MSRRSHRSLSVCPLRSRSRSSSCRRLGSASALNTASIDHNMQPNGCLSRGRTWREPARVPTCSTCGSLKKMPSSVIRDVDYDEERRLLEITFVSGRIYAYRDVPAEVFADLQMARSKGEFFNRHIRDCFDYSEVNDRKVG